MSLPDRRSVLGLFLLAGCGFTPAYGPSGPAATLQDTIRADDPSDKYSFDLVQRLEERLGRPQAERFALSYSISIGAVGVGITQDNVITRYNLTGTIDWTVTEIATQTRVTGGRVNSFTSWSATGSTVAGLTAQEDAGLRLMRLLADQIVTQLTATSGTWLT
ncbi:MAG: LPS assembly lipoprotein LptE [Paracoccaceae bacterium]